MCDRSLANWGSATCWKEVLGHQANVSAVTGQLIDAETGKHIWAERYDRQLEDVFAVQDEITQNVVATIEPHLYVEESLRFINQPPESVATWGLVVRALTLINKVDRKANQEAQALLNRAIGREPSYARAYAILAWAKWWEGLINGLRIEPPLAVQRG